MVHYTALAGRVKHTDIQYETGGGRGERKMGGEGKEGRGLLTQQGSPVESVGPTSKK